MTQASVSFKIPGICCEKQSPDIHSLGECAVYLSQSWDFGTLSHFCIPVNTKKTSDRLGANRRMVEIPCHPERYAAGFILSRTRTLAVTHSILTWSYLYIPRDFPLIVLSSSSGIPTSFCYHIPLHFHTSNSWLQKHPTKVQEDRNRTEWPALNPIHHPPRQNYNADIS